MSNAQKLTRAEQKALRPTQILDAAFEEFVKTGFTATRVEDIAERVGVTKGTIYVYFDTKERLFEAMIEHISVPFEEILATLQTLEGGCGERLLGFLGILYDHLVEDRKARELLRFVIAEGPKFPELIDRHHHEFIAPIILRIQAILDEGVAKREFRKRPSEFADIVVAPIMAMLMFRMIFDDRRPMDKNAFLRAHVDLILHGLISK